MLFVLAPTIHFLPNHFSLQLWEYPSYLPFHLHPSLYRSQYLSVGLICLRRPERGPAVCVCTLLTQTGKLQLNFQYVSQSDTTLQSEEHTGANWVQGVCSLRVIQVDQWLEDCQFNPPGKRKKILESDEYWGVMRTFQSKPSSHAKNHDRAVNSMYLSM